MCRMNDALWVSAARFRGLIASASLKLDHLLDTVRGDTRFRGLIASASLKHVKVMRDFTLEVDSEA